jgi:hypothetical protein
LWGLPAVGTSKSVDDALNLIYGALYSKANRDIDHNGSSTYAEITRDSVTAIINTIENCFMPLLTQREASTFRAVDLGGGYLTCLSHIAQVIPGEYLGIEYCVRRTLQFAKGHMALLARHADELYNTKIAYSNMDILDLHAYDCYLVYTFDEGFPPDVWEKIIETFVASHRCKFFIMFKVGKSAKGNARVLEKIEQAGIMKVHKLTLAKKGGEGSNAMFFVKDKSRHQHIGRVLRSQNCLPDQSDWVWEQCKAFWGGIEMAKKAVAELKANADHQVETEKAQRKW